jgi:hypothetical protein
MKIGRSTSEGSPQGPCSRPPLPSDARKKSDITRPLVGRKFIQFFVSRTARVTRRSVVGGLRRDLPCGRSRERAGTGRGDGRRKWQQGSYARTGTRTTTSARKCASANSAEHRSRFAAPAVTYRPWGGGSALRAGSRLYRSTNTHHHSQGSHNRCPRADHRHNLGSHNRCPSARPGGP